MANRILHILIAVFVWCNIVAQPKPTLPHYKQYTLHDGLSQMQVTSMFQDSRGYIWVGTKAGLNCFNGDKFTSYTTKKFPKMPYDYIHDIGEDSQGRIWASTNMGIFRVDGEDIKFFKVESFPDLIMTADEHGKIWFVKTKYPDPKFSIHYIEADSIKQLQIDLPVSKGYPRMELKYIEEEDAILLANDTALYRIKNNNCEFIHRNNNFIHFFLGIKTPYFIEGYLPEINSDWETRNFDLKQYVGGNIKVVARIRNGKLAENLSLTDTLHYVTALLPNKSFILTPDTIHYNAFNGLQTSCILFDKEGKYWVGSEEGFFQLFGNAFTAYSREYLPQVWAVTEDKNQNLWFSSFMFGLTKQDNGRLYHYPNHFIKNAAYTYFHPVLDRRGRLFFPNAHGILMADGQKFEQKGECFYITAFYDKERDLVWGGRKKGAEAFDPNRQQIRVIDEKLGLDVGNNVLTIGKDTSGFYWFGGGTGLARYNWHTNSLKNYKPGNRNTGVYTQRNDFKGRTWFGTKDGLYWFNTKADSLCKIERDELNDLVSMLEPIDSSWLIVSQPYGIYLMDLQKYYQAGEVVLHLFNEKNGFTGIEPGQDGAFTDSRGNVWMTTSTELMKLDPRKLNPGKNSLAVRIDKLNGEKLPFLTQQLVLPRNQNSAVLTFDAICFNRSNRVEYSWKLENDTVWSPWQEEDYVVVAGLEDGNTPLMVRARIKGLPITNAVETTVNVQVRIAIYRQPWFLPTLFVFISLIGICFLFIALLRMKKANREAKIFQIQAIQSQMNPHFIFNVLASLQSMILKSNISKANDYLVKLADLIRGFLEASAGTGSLKSPQSNEGQVTVASELALLKEFVDFQQVINPERFDFEIQIEENIDPQKELIPPMLIQPFIENAIRHGLLPSKNKGLLLLSFRKSDEALDIEIRDNGVGIEKAKQMSESSPMHYVSRGSELTMNRVKLLNQLGFRIEIRTESNQENTSVKIKLYKYGFRN